MSANTKIEWADHTFNPWIGCTQVSPGCDHCYAKAEWDDRRHRAVWGPGYPRSRTKTWGDPEKWNKQRFMECSACRWRGALVAPIIGCPNCGSIELDDTRARVFCASLADVFDNEVPVEWRNDLFDLIHETRNLDWLLLTKRIGNVMKMLPSATSNRDADGFARLWPHVWIGATIVNQEEADRDIPKLLAVPAAKRFLSMEPLLGPVDLRYLQPGDPPTEINALAGTHGVLRPHRGACDRIDWVIVGGESGPSARPMHPDWARSLRDQCQAAGVPFFFKQWGEWAPWDDDNWSLPDGADDALAHERAREVDGVEFLPVGKKIAGRYLDGRTWDEVPI